jgi:hypothetical protein
MSETKDHPEQKVVVRKGHDRRLPGFEETQTSKSWQSPFFFVQAADTQLGMIVNYGDGTIRYKLHFLFNITMHTF